MTRADQISNTISRLNKRIESNSYFSKYNRSRIFKRARFIMKDSRKTWSESLKQSWSEAKESVLNARKEIAEIKSQLLNFFTPKAYINLNKQHQNFMAVVTNNGTISIGQSFKN